MRSVRQILLEYLRWAPVSLTIREVSRIHSLKILNDRLGVLQAQSILDVGCGDGRWWLNVLPDGLQRIHGIDISFQEIDLAQQLIWAKCVDITAPNISELVDQKKFDLVIGNCSMEHILHIDKAIKNIYELLNENGTFILYVPTPYWAFKGKGIALLGKISPRLSMMVSGMINGFFQHWHLYHYKIWESLLGGFEFKDIKSYGLGNNRTEFLFRLFMPASFASFVVKQLTGKYLNYFVNFLVPTSLLNQEAKLIERHLDNELKSPNSNDIFEYIIVCRK